MELSTNRRGTFTSMEYLDPTRVRSPFEMPLAELIIDYFDQLKSPQARGVTRYSRRGRRDQLQRELALQALLDDLHVEGPRNPQRNPKPRRSSSPPRRLKLASLRWSFFHRVAEQRVVLARDRVDPREDEALGWQISRQRLPAAWGKSVTCRPPARPDALEARGDVADLAGGQLVDRTSPGRRSQARGSRSPHRSPFSRNPRVLADRPSQADVGHTPCTGRSASRDERAKWRSWFPFGGGTRATTPPGSP